MMTDDCNGFCQVLPVVCELLLLWGNSDRLFLHFGAEGGATTHPQQIPSLHFLCPVPHRSETSLSQHGTSFHHWCFWKLKGLGKL